MLNTCPADDSMKMPGRRHDQYQHHPGKSYMVTWRTYGWQLFLCFHFLVASHPSNMQSVSQKRTCFHTCRLTQSQHPDIRPTSPSTDPMCQALDKAATGVPVFKSLVLTPLCRKRGFNFQICHSKSRHLTTKPRTWHVHQHLQTVNNKEDKKSQ